MDKNYSQDGTLPILIVDKKGTIGTLLAKQLREKFLVVIVTSHDQEKHDNVIHLPYRRKLPLIPDNVYSHFFVVYNGESEILDLLPAFDEKADAVKAKLFLITSLLYSSQRLFHRLSLHPYKTLQTVVFGETFDNDLSETNEITYFIRQARNYGRIEVPNEGLGPLYPILLDDVLSSIIALAFAEERQTRPVLLFPHHVYDQVSVARIIQKRDPMMKVDFRKRKVKKHHYYIPKNGVYFYRDYRLDDRFRLITVIYDPKKAKVPQKKMRLRMPTPENEPMRLKLFLIVLLAVFIAPLVVTFFCALAGAGFLALSLKQFEQGAIDSAESNAVFAQRSFESASALGPSLLLPQMFLPLQKQQFLTTMQTGETVSQTEVSLLQSIQTLQLIYEKKSLDPKNDFLKSLATIKNSLLTIQKLEAEQQLPQQVLHKLSSYDDLISLLEGTIDTWPTILGFEGKKTYLVLFQNNMELRPGGGFIGSYGVLPIENGQVGKLQINDVYDADGKLTQSIEPPYGLRRYLGASHWYLRDSNFDPDFSVDAQQAQSFLKKETGQNVDGVIAIDTAFLKQLLAVFGSVRVSDYNETVTPDNFYLLTQTHVEKDFFPGSTQKKDFLRSLTNALMDKLFQEKKLPYEKLAQAIVTSIHQKHLLFAFADKGIQDVFTVNDLSSSLHDDRKQAKNTAFDFQGIIDANVGTNKANYYVKRSIVQTVHIDSLGELQETADVRYTNTSTKTSPFGGDYRDYVRFLLPPNTTLTGVRMNNQAVQTIPAVTDPSIYAKSGFVPPKALEVDQGEVGGKKSIGFFFIVPAGETKTVSVTYTVATPIDTRGTEFGYNLRLFKQAGAGEDPYQLWLSYPTTFSVITNSDGLTDVGGKLSYQEPLSEDLDLQATFSKK